MVEAASSAHAVGQDQVAEIVCVAGETPPA
jgi:hypothetical protein